MFSYPTEYDIAVVGAGHAGIEAALAAARLGCRTLLLTQNLDTIGQMSCNPAIGGSAKGHIVREIDALGGFMGQNADATGIQFRLLNRTRGPSVQAPRAQCDKKAYQLRAKATLERTAGLDVKQAGVDRVVVHSGGVTGVETDIGVFFPARTVIITSGTFLRGLLHVGSTSKPGGRMADATSGLSASLRELGFEVGRFKTGTPCRINRHSIDFSACEIQWGDEPRPHFSFVPVPQPADHAGGASSPLQPFHVEQVPCWITHTTPATHEIIRKNLDRSPLYSGRIAGTGPRYCPSIEDKVVKFPEKTAHQIFLEPEGLHTDEFYVNGISTSLPYDVQLAFVQSMPGLKRAEIMRPGYAVEYDYFPPTQLHHTLETKLVPGLYFAGQVNGTSGYEEAAAQGLIAGANAALKILEKSRFALSRTEAFVGVLIDDLVTKGVEEPYRMFTSRAAERLSLRHDTADQRLTPRGRAIGLVDEHRWATFQQKLAKLEATRRFVETTRINGQPLSAAMKQQTFSYQAMPEELRAMAPADIYGLVEVELKYEGYVRRQRQQSSLLERSSEVPIPTHLNFDDIPGLRLETRQRLAKVRPATLGALSRTAGITSADASIIRIWLTANN